MAEIIFQTFCLIQLTMALQFRIHMLRSGHEYEQLVNRLLTLDQRLVNLYSVHVQKGKNDICAQVLRGNISGGVVNVLLYGVLYFSMGPSFPLYKNTFLLAYSPVDASLLNRVFCLFHEIWLYLQAYYGVISYYAVTIIGLRTVRFWFIQLTMDSHVVQGQVISLYKPKRDLFIIYRSIQLLMHAFNECMQGIIMIGRNLFGPTIIICGWFAYINFYNEMSATGLLYIPFISCAVLATAGKTYPLDASIESIAASQRRYWVSAAKRIGLGQREVRKFVRSEEASCRERV